MMTDKTDEKIKKYYPMLYKYVYVQLKDADVTLDIVQEVLYKYVESKIIFDNDSAEKAWLLTVTNNICRNYWRSSWYKRIVLVSDEFDSYNSLTPEDIFLQNENNYSVLSLVMSLPAKYRDVIHLFYYENLKIEDISRITGKKISTIQTHLERARKLLKRKMEKDGF